MHVATCNIKAETGNSLKDFEDNFFVVVFLLFIFTTLQATALCVPNDVVRENVSNLRSSFNINYHNPSDYRSLYKLFEYPSVETLINPVHLPYLLCANTTCVEDLLYLRFIIIVGAKIPNFLLRSNKHWFQQNDFGYVTFRILSHVKKLKK